MKTQTESEENETYLRRSKSEGHKKHIVDSWKILEDLAIKPKKWVLFKLIRPESKRKRSFLEM